MRCSKPFFQHRSVKALIGMSLLFGLLFACVGKTTPNNNKAKPLNIATAANMQFVMDSLIKAFEATTGIACHIILGSSGKLMAQIEQGAPYDVFVSANYAYAKRLYEKDLTLKHPTICAYGNLVLWTLDDDWEEAITLPNLSKHIEKGTKIALANPKFAPYGRASVEALEYVGIYEQLKANLVYGESIAQTNQFILSGVVKAGLTSQSVVVSPTMKHKGRWKALPKTSYSKIEQTAVALAHSQQIASAQLFCDFLMLPQNKQIWTQFGYEWSNKAQTQPKR